LLQSDSVQLAQLEHRVTLGQPALDPILGRMDNCLCALSCEEPQRLVGTELVPAGGLPPYVLKVGAVGEMLRPAVLEREVPQLPALRRAPVPGTEPVGCPRNLSGAPGEGIAQILGDACDLEVLAVLSRRLFD
jgi:hypothetical protein